MIVTLPNGSNVRPCLQDLHIAWAVPNRLTGHSLCCLQASLKKCRSLECRDPGNLSTSCGNIRLRSALKLLCCVALSQAPRSAARKSLAAPTYQNSTSLHSPMASHDRLFQSSICNHPVAKARSAEPSDNKKVVFFLHDINC